METIKQLEVGDNEIENDFKASTKEHQSVIR